MTLSPEQVRQLVARTPASYLFPSSIVFFDELLVAYLRLVTMKPKLDLEDARAIFAEYGRQADRHHRGDPASPAGDG